MRKLGTSKHPAIVRVQSNTRGEQIVHLCNQRGWQVIVGIEPDKEEDISDVEKLLNPPKSIINSETIGRNDPCFCGSGLKYKKCHGK